MLFTLWESRRTSDPCLPPLVYISDLGEAIKNSWSTSPELEPPFGHAKLASLQTFCKKQRIPLDQAMLELRKAGFMVDSSKSTLIEIAESKRTSGMGVYKVIKKLADKNNTTPIKLMTIILVEDSQIQ
jgi:hypothetical protein